jgi:hypoxanthine phosphoribosyltransferase
MESPQFADRMSRILYTEAVLQQRVHTLAEQIAGDYTQRGLAQDPHQRPLMLVGVLRGAMVFMADLARSLPMSMEYDLISMSSYGNGTAPGAVRLVKDLEKPIEGRDVLLLEDIIDTGHTIDYLRRSFSARNPASFRVCALIDKTVRRERETTIEYVGFELSEDAFVVGYGMDYAGLYRNLPYVGVLKPEFIDG